MDILSSSEHEQWDQFVTSCADGTLFHTTWWYRAWGMEPTVLAMKGKDGRIEGGICYCVGRRFMAKAVVRPPLTPRNGPIFADSQKFGRYAKNTHAKKMMLAAINSLPRLGLYDFILRPCDIDVMPFLWNGFDSLLSYTYVIPRCEKETWTQHASKSQRKDLRRARQDASDHGYTIDNEPTLDEVMPIFRATADFKNYSLAHIVERLPAWWDQVVRRGAGRAYLLRDGEGRAASASLMAYDDKCAYKLIGGMRDDLRKTRMHKLIADRQIQDALDMGLDFDFEGSSLPGPEQYFRSLGGELRPLYRLVKIPSLWSYLIWSGYRYWTGHRKRPWISYE